jgi:hypothetical protein
MITKAGVPSNKILVGVASYGRSFQMTTPGCTGPMCTYTGPQSGATKGPCTATAGYIGNAEIRMLLDNGHPGVVKFEDDSGSDIVVYNDVQWVAYMTEERKQGRIQTYRNLNFGGVSDWAVDLQTNQPPHEALPSTSTTFQNIDPIMKNCPGPVQPQIVLQAWREAGQIVDYHHEWSPKGSWQAAMDMYMGTNTRTDWDWWGDPGPVGRKSPPRAVTASCQHSEASNANSRG